MADKAISNTSPLLYLHRCGGLAWLPRLFTLVCVPGAVASELERVGVGPRQIHTSQGIRPKIGLFFELKTMFSGLKKGF